MSYALVGRHFLRIDKIITFGVPELTKTKCFFVRLMDSPNKIMIDSIYYDDLKREMEKYYGRSFEVMGFNDENQGLKEGEIIKEGIKELRDRITYLEMKVKELES